MASHEKVKKKSRRVGEVDGIEIRAERLPSKKGQDRLWITFLPKEGSGWRTYEVLGYPVTPRIQFARSQGNKK